MGYKQTQLHPISAPCFSSYTSYYLAEPTNMWEECRLYYAVEVGLNSTESLFCAPDLTKAPKTHQAHV